MLFSAIDNISADKKRGEQQEMKLNELDKLHKDHVVEIKTLKGMVSNTLGERDEFR